MGEMKTVLIIADEKVVLHRRRSVIQQHSFSHEGRFLALLDYSITEMGALLGARNSVIRYYTCEMPGGYRIHIHPARNYGIVDYFPPFERREIVSSSFNIAITQVYRSVLMLRRLAEYIIIVEEKTGIV